MIEYTEPGLQGDRSSGGTKPATLETGHEIQVPLFITTGEKVKVDTRDGRTSVASAADRAMPPAPRPANGRSTSCSSASSAGCAVGRPRRAAGRGRPPVNDYTVDAGRGVEAHQTRIDDLISTYSTGWTIDRMPAVDRTCCGSASSSSCTSRRWRLPWRSVEAVGLVKRPVDRRVPAFVNGVLGNILRNKPALSG